MSKKSEKKETDRFVASFDDLDIANELRSRLIFDLKPKPWVYVMTESLEDGPDDVKVANEHGGRMNDQEFEEAIVVYDKFLSGSNNLNDMQC